MRLLPSAHDAAGTTRRTVDRVHRPHLAFGAMSVRRATVITLVAAYLAVQLLVPALALLEPRPAHFGWQMYSALPRLPQAWVLETDGTERPVDLTELFAVQRAEIDYGDVLRTGLCDATGAAAIKLQRSGDAEPETVTCP